VNEVIDPSTPAYLYLQILTITFLSLSFRILYLPVILNSYRNCYLRRFISAFFGTARVLMFFCSYTKFSYFQKELEYSIAILSSASRIYSRNSLTDSISKGVGGSVGGGFMRSLEVSSCSSWSLIIGSDRFSLTRI
jgi:hypothetical protein